MERPFARTSLEATQLIERAIDGQQAELSRCVVAARARRKEPRAKIVLDIGIDQDGNLIGVKVPKGAPPDDALTDCMKAALRTALFPSSHAGVITVKKTFEEMALVQ